MRIYLKTTPNKQPVSFNYQPKLVGTLHKWLGNNNIHGKIAFHSFSWLMGGELIGGALRFSDGAGLFISFYDSSQIQRIVKSILADPDLFAGMSVIDVIIEEDPDLSGQELFRVASPVFIRRMIGTRDIHYTYQDEECGRLLVETMKHKMQESGLPEDETLDIRFALDYNKKKVKLMEYNGVKNKASWCPVIIKGKPDTKIFAWNVGVGNSTGIGMGAIY